MISRKVLLLGTTALGVFGIGIYNLMPSSSSSKLSPKHRKIFEEVYKTYSSKGFVGSNKKIVRIEVMNPDDPWWNEKWKEYKEQSSSFQSIKKEAKENLEVFQGVCYEEIRRLGPDLGQTAKYSNDKGKLVDNRQSEGHLTYSDVQDKKFIWEMCLKITVTP